MSTKISAMTAAGSLTGAELVPVVQGGNNRRTTAQAIADLGGLGYLVYTALLTQTSGGDPTAVILGSNTIGAIVWTYDTNGVYFATLAGAFPVNKVWAPGGVINSRDDYDFSVVRNSDDVLAFKTANAGTLEDDLFNSTPIEIRVYP